MRTRTPAKPVPKFVEALMSRRAEFHRFITARVGNASDAEDILQDSVVKALGEAGALRREERAVAWFYRILRNGIVDHQRRQGAERKRHEHIASDLKASGSDHSAPPKDWDAAICACFVDLLPTLNPRYAELIRRVDLNREFKPEVARELKIKPATLDVALHRARSALRERLTVFCGRCSRETCLECFCGATVV